MHEDDALEALLREEPLDVPPDFASQVMARVHQQALPQWSVAARPMKRWQELGQWLVLLASTTAGVLQLGSFVFGIWTAAGAA